jgi:hypothetical protein
MKKQCSEKTNWIFNYEKYFLFEHNSQALDFQYSNEMLKICPSFLFEF